MPRYSFHVYHGRSEFGFELESMNLPDFRAAKKIALRFASDTIRDADRDDGNREWKIEVTSEDKDVLYIVRFTSFEPDNP